MVPTPTRRGSTVAALAVAVVSTVAPTSSAAQFQTSPSVPMEDTMCAGPFAAAAAGAVPEDGRATVAGVDLPAGREVLDGRLWVSDEWVPDVYRVWAELAGAFNDTGLWPVLWVAPRLDDLNQPVEPPVKRTVEDLLSEQWGEFVGMLDDLAAEFVAPFGADFPGLAPAQTECRRNVVDHYRTADPSESMRIALVAVERPADVPSVLGWNETEDFEYSAQITAMLRSWEDRFGAYLKSFAPGSIELAVERPPRSEDDRWLWAAEQLAFTSYGPLNSGSLANFVRQNARNPYVVNFTWD